MRVSTIPSGQSETRPPACVTVFVCTTCRHPDQPADDPPAGAALAETLAATADPAVVTLRPVQCLANCRRGPSAAIARPGAWTYVFGNLFPDQCAVALLEGARLLAGSTDGLMPWRGRPEALKRGLIARVPPLETA